MNYKTLKPKKSNEILKSVRYSIFDWLPFQIRQKSERSMLR